ncbi:hypothetical protein HDU96_004067 [Phlyctochytrium bullatum]|nr:hypothetical protein HDU96_004067 [Phlyctochytrium bullatum]
MTVTDPTLILRLATAEECLTTYRRTFDYWGRGYEDTEDAWARRKVAYNAQHGIRVWVMVREGNDGDDGEGVLAHAEMQTIEGWFCDGEDGADSEVSRGKVVSVGGVFVPEELRGRGYGQAIVSLLNAQPAHLGGEGARGSCLMAGGADPVFYGKKGYNLCTYKLFALGPDRIVEPLVGVREAWLQRLVGVTDEVLEAAAGVDAERLKEEVRKAGLGAVSLIPTKDIHTRVSGVYLTFGNAPVAPENRCQTHGVTDDDSTPENQLLWAHFYRNKRLCITRLSIRRPMVGDEGHGEQNWLRDGVIVFLEAARREAVSRGFEWIYLWVGEGDPLMDVLLVDGKSTTAFEPREWFDEPMFQRYPRAGVEDQSTEVGVVKWVANQRWVTTTM